MRESPLSVSHSLLKSELLAKAGVVLFMMTFSFGFTPLQYVSSATGPERPLMVQRIIPHRGLEFRKPSQGFVAAKLGNFLVLSHQHFRSSSRPRCYRLHQ